MIRHPRKINPQHLSELIRLVNSSPYFSLLGMRILELAPGHARVELHIGQEHLNPFGSIHGGVCASLIDTAAYWAAYCDQEEEAGFTSLDVSVTNLAMVNSGTLTATATAIKEGKSVCLCEASVHDDSGRLIAHGTSHLLILNARQSVADVLRACSSDQLPPKFLLEE